MGYSTLKAALDAVVKTNGRQQITGANLNGVMTTLLQGVDILNRANPADTSGLNKVVLDKSKTFAEQVTGTNTIYEIRDNFNLSAEVNIPAGSVLYFNGGSITGSAINCNGTMLIGDVKCADIKGTISNDKVFASWFTASNFANIATCAFNSGATLYVDKNIAMDGTQKSVSSIRIDGFSRITNPCSFIVTGDLVSVKNVSISSVSITGNFIKIDGSSNARLEVKNIDFDGSNSCKRFFDWFDTSQTTNLELDVTGCTIKNVLEGAILSAGDSTGRISDNTFDGIGTTTDTTITTQCAIRLGRQYLGNGFAQNVIISNNIFRNIKSPYLSGDDAKETHAILLYGYNCIVDGNYVDEIYSSRSDRDPGTETEGIYLKGSYHKITNNVLINAAGGTNCDGAITLKGLSDIAENNRHFNIISGNIVRHTRGYGDGITCYGVKTSVDDNVVDIADSTGYCMMFLIAVDCTIRGNKVYTTRSSGSVVAYMTAFSADQGCDRLHFSGNIIQAATIITTTVNTGTFYFDDNHILCKDSQYGTSSRYQSFINKSSGSPVYYFRGNRIYVDSCRANAFIVSVNDLHFENNYFKFFTTEGSPVTPYFAGIFRYVDRVELVDNIIDASGYASMQLVYQSNEGAVLVSENTKYTGTTTITNGTASVISRNSTILGQKNMGTTEERQAVVLRWGAGMEGYQFFDTTLFKMCFAKAIAYNTGVVTWVDATGAVVQ